MRLVLTERGGVFPWLLAACLVLAAAPLAAQESDAVEDTDLVWNDDLFQWVSPSIEVQLEEDRTRIPTGMGAIFVPTMSATTDEPEVTVSGASERDGGSTGERIIVPPGAYSLRVGSGTRTQATVIRDIQVVGGETTVVPVTWSGLRITVVDENNLPHRGAYELIRLNDRELFGVGFGADTLQGERLETWLLPPGTYRIVQPGANYRARTNFATVTLPEGGLANFKLVMDPITGEFLGAGLLSPSELGFEGGSSNWTRTMVIGLDAGLAHSDAYVGVPDQISMSGDLFFDTYVVFDDRTNLFSAIVELEEGMVWIDPAEGDALPLQKSRDSFRLDLLYSYFLNPNVGPYVRIGVLANIFPAQVVVTEDSTVRRVQTDGTTQDEAVLGGQSFNIGGYLPQLNVREGVGLNARLLRTNWVSLSLRLGVGLRQNFFNEAFVVDDDSATPELEYNAIDNFNQEGMESTLTGRLRLSSFLTYITDVEYFSAFDEFDRPTIDWQNTVSLRFASYVSLDYTVNLLSVPQISDALQLSQNILLRFSYSLL